MVADQPSPVTKGERAKGARTKRRLLELAVERFGAEGYRATSVSEIARAAGVSQATVYAYFDNKESLFVAALDAEATELVREAHAALVEVPVGDRPRLFLYHLYDGLERRPLTRRVLGGLEPEFIAHVADLPALHVATELIIGDLRASQAVGDVRADIDPAAIAQGLEAMIVSLLIGAVQSEGVFIPRYLRGIEAAFDAILKPPTDP